MTFPTVVAKDTYISICNLLHGTVPGASNAPHFPIRKGSKFPLGEEDTVGVNYNNNDTD